MFKETWDQLEAEIDIYSANRTLDCDASKSLLDAYYDSIIMAINELNFDEHSMELKAKESYHRLPLNFFERIHYIESRKYHFMGYQQMKTMNRELIKLLAVKNIKNQQKK
ncbi:YpoC family protein [Macrococcus sp. DPC7161]|uniref:YpoC family protein n=1 Tax=Macrococcus sp. DPC7161 TaxID=2507060 RepID=UPI00100BC719|nr:hypothetical protein [Macrococcus sp. DPC7161]RXK19257.1 hypothetical protein ER639_02770 [Macrococcus sp. DPC7161]